jgi:hypothetical protein
MVPQCQKHPKQKRVAPGLEKRNGEVINASVNIP